MREEWGRDGWGTGGLGGWGVGVAVLVAVAEMEDGNADDGEGGESANLQGRR